MGFFEKLKQKGIYFNENQLKAITHVDGPLLVAAGPGSGKTSVITARTTYLIQKAGINPSNILVITFTRAAANEMKERFKYFSDISGKDIEKVDFGTFHSTFYKIINSYYGRPLPVLDTNKAYSIIKNILRSLNEPYDDETIENALSDISLARTTVKSVEDFNSEHFSNTKFHIIYSQYEQNKKALKSIDFDDMLFLCRDILYSHDNILKFYRNKYKYILIDEFQDTNEIQFDIVKLLSHPINNICAVGDDDQSIYGFRGTLPDCLIKFEEYYKPCKTVILDMNYRSTKEIIDISKKVISYNTKRKDKDLRSVRGSGKAPITITPPNEEMEACFIADTIEDMKKQGHPYKNFVVLYRTNIQSRPIIDELIRRNIPFNIRDGINNFFSHWICRDITCYLKLAMNNNDILSFVQIVNRPARYISKYIISNLTDNHGQEEFNIIDFLGNYGLKEFQMEKIYSLFNQLKSLSSMTPSSAIASIRKSIGYDNYIRNYCMESNMNIEELTDIMDEYEMSSSNFKTIPEFLWHISEVSSKLNDNKFRFPHSKDCITLSTIHGAKGLEFPFVFIIGVIEGLLPHKKSIKTVENIEEERRLFYVALTRAKDMVFISSPQRHHGKKAQISRFFKEASMVESSLKDKDIDINNTYKFNIGELIYHKMFGTGKIICINKGILEVLFKSKTGKKQLDIKTCIENKLLER